MKTLVLLVAMMTAQTDLITLFTGISTVAHKTCWVVTLGHKCKPKKAAK